MFKIIVIGDSGVGNTNLILKFSDRDFNHDYLPTIGLEFNIKTILIGEKRVQLQLSDTAGQ
jgi:GTPase SAR1 family protein